MTTQLFCGYDVREALGFHVFCASVIEHARDPVAIRALNSRCMPVGTNAFTFSRFLVPWLMDYRGHAIFADACDMLMLGDIGDLDALFDPRLAVQVVQHPSYETLHPVKYRGTAMECRNANYARKNWASLMLMNCEHPYWQAITPRTLAPHVGLPLLQLADLRAVGPEPTIGALPDCWNRLVDEGQATAGAQVLHWTAGMPGFTHYRHAPGAALWHAQLARMLEVD
jgi:hypothetical protein